MPSYILEKTRRYSLNEYAVTSSVPVATDWANRVVKNGGARPSNTTINALQTFYNTLSSSRLISKMITVNCFAPDNLTASFTPLIVNGNDPWINSGFAGSDLTPNGLQGNASKYLKTGCKPILVLSNSSSLGFSVYNMTSSTHASIDIGGLGSACVAYINGDGGTGVYFDCWNQLGGRLTGASAYNAGLISFNRTNISSSTIYKATTASFTTIASSTTQTAVGSIPTDTAGTQIFVFAGNSSDSALYPTNRRLSFAAVHLGLSSDEVKTLYSASSTMREEVGGARK